MEEFKEQPMYDVQIKKYCYDHFQKFDGTIAHDDFHPHDRMYIINTGGHKSGGIHWIGCYVTPDCAYFFDSFHTNIHNIVKDVDKHIHNRRIVVSRNAVLVQNDQDPREKTFVVNFRLPGYTASTIEG